MTDLWADADRRAREYARRNSLLLCDQLGAGQDGIVFATDAGSAVKSLRYAELYVRERDVYIRLQQAGVDFGAGCNVPRLVKFDDSLHVVEMELVQPPFIVDFAGARLDEPPDYPEEILAEWEAAKREEFESKWPLVQVILSEFEKLGIYLTDVKPGNIQFD